MPLAPFASAPLVAKRELPTITTRAALEGAGFASSAGPIATASETGPARSAGSFLTSLARSLRFRSPQPSADVSTSIASDTPSGGFSPFVTDRASWKITGSFASASDRTIGWVP